MDNSITRQRAPSPCGRLQAVFYQTNRGNNYGIAGQRNVNRKCPHVWCCLRGSSFPRNALFRKGAGFLCLQILCGARPSLYLAEGYCLEKLQPAKRHQWSRSN